jgi:hypothetical protein
VLEDVSQSRRYRVHTLPRRNHTVASRNQKASAHDLRLVDYLRALTVVSYGTFLDAELHVSSDKIATC